jgi:hypothetical protein
MIQAESACADGFCTRFRKAGYLNLIVTSKTKEELLIQLFDASGQLVQTENRELVHGTSSVDLMIKHLSCGVYFINTKTNSSSLYGKFIKTD